MVAADFIDASLRSCPRSYKAAPSPAKFGEIRLGGGGEYLAHKKPTHGPLTSPNGKELGAVLDWPRPPRRFQRLRCRAVLGAMAQHVGVEAVQVDPQPLHHKRPQPQPSTDLSKHRSTRARR